MKTLASIDISLANLLDALGARADADSTGLDIQHDIRACLQATAVYQSVGCTRPELAELVDRAVAVRIRGQVYLAARARNEAHGVAPTEQRAIAEALAGPRDDETLEQCPACAGCGLCKDARMVTVRAAAAWRAP